MGLHRQKKKKKKKKTECDKEVCGGSWNKHFRSNILFYTLRTLLILVLVCVFLRSKNPLTEVSYKTAKNPLTEVSHKSDFWFS